MEIGAQCKECRKFIKKGEKYWHKKHDDDVFCSRDCLEKDTIDNIDARIGVVGDE